MQARLALACCALAALPAAVGCGDSSGSSGSPDLAAVAPPRSLVFVEGTIRPSGELKANADAIAARVADVDNLGDFVVEKLEEAAREDGEPIDFESEIEPWLGDRGSLAFETVEEDGDLSEPVLALQSTDVAATRRFIEEQARGSVTPVSEGSYKGVEYSVGGPERSVIGVIGDLYVQAEDRRSFERAVDASADESLADLARYEQAISAASEGSLADVYVDVGGIIEASEDEVDEEALTILRGAGIDPNEATAVASVVPGQDRIEIDLSSDLGGSEAPSGNASELLGSMPAGSFAAVGVSGFGQQLEEAIESLDKSGIPGEVPPGELKSGLRSAGIDLDRFAGSLGDAAIFAEGDSEASLGGALILTSNGSGQAANTISTLGMLLRASDTPGVTAITGKASGFSVRDEEELGDKPLVVVTKGDRIAIGYGLEPTMKGVLGKGPTLSETPAYEEAVAALGETPIGAFVDGPAALRLAEALVPRSETDFQEARPYLRKISSIALGSASQGDLATAKLIVSLE
jgi:hypothetical protein